MRLGLSEPQNSEKGLHRAGASTSEVGTMKLCLRIPERKAGDW